MTNKERMEKVKAFQEGVTAGLVKMDLARTYFEDGALMTTARILREAASLFEAAQAARNEALT